MADFSTLVETFDTLDTATTWSPSGTVSVAGSQLVIRPDAVSVGQFWSHFLYTQARWLLGNYDEPPYGVVEFVPYATRNNGKASWSIVNSNAAKQGIYIEQTGATGYRSAIMTDQYTTLTDVKSYTTTDRFWRVGMDSGNIYNGHVLSSADGVTWTFRATHNVTTDLFTWRFAGAATFVMLFRLADGTGSTALPAFQGINEPPPKTSVTAVVATSSSRAPVPVVRQWTTVNLAAPATATAAAPPPTLWVHLAAPVSMSYALAPAPTLNLPVPVFISAPVITVSAAAPAPTVLAPTPTKIVLLAAAPASIQLLAPGEEVHVTTPVAVATAALPTPVWAGRSLSRFASTVVQTPQNWGGAAVYYRLNDTGATLTDIFAQHHGTWSGTHPLVTGSVALDSDKATQFDPASTTGYTALMPNYQSFHDPGVGDPTNADWRADEWPRMWGWSAMVVFKTLAGSTRQNYLFSRAEPSLSVPPTDASLRVDTLGRIIARWYRASISNPDWQEVIGPAVNDGNWHMAVMTSGYPMQDPLGGKNPCRLYLDGVLLGYIGQFGVATPKRPLTIGGSVASPAYEGSLDEYAEFDYTLSQWEVLELWNQMNNLSGPPTYVTVEGAATLSASAPAPTVRKSAVVPLNEFFDAFGGTTIDRSLWRDASPTARIINGAAVLRASGEQLLTADYFQCMDSSFIVKLAALPFREGHVFLGLINEHETIPDAVYGGSIQYDAQRPRRTIGFDIYKSTTTGIPRITLVCSAVGEEFNGVGKRERIFDIPPDDPNYPTSVKWLRLDIDPGLHGGATWLTSPDGVNWEERCDVHGGQANVKTKLVPSKLPAGGMVEKTTISYENPADFFLFDPGSGPVDKFPGGIVAPWQGYMRVKIFTDGGNVATDFRADNVNVPPEGTGTPVSISAKPARVQTSSTTEYLLYALQPRVYNSASDVAVEVPGPATASVRFPKPPEPVYIFAPVLQAQSLMLEPQRAGEAVPVAIPTGSATAQVQAIAPSSAGKAQPIQVNPPQATATVSFIDELGVFTDLSAPAVQVATPKPVITLVTRNIRVTVTQN